MWQDETNEYFRCKHGTPAKATEHGGLRSHAASIYTLVLFKMFDGELCASLGMDCVKVNSDGNTSFYHLIKAEKKRVYGVNFDSSNHLVTCTCKLFETLGLLCRHNLRVLIVNNINMILSCYIVSRWTKNAKKGLCYNPLMLTKKMGKAERLVRLTEKNYMGQSIFDKASITSTGT